MDPGDSSFDPSYANESRERRQSVHPPQWGVGDSVIQPWLVARHLQKEAIDTWSRREVTSMTRKRMIALLFVSLLSIGTAVTLSGRETLEAKGAEAGEARVTEVLEPNQGLSAPPNWVLEDWSWM